MDRAHVYLVPGFFGFTSLGALNYFFRVAETLRSALKRRGIAASIVECKTRPTGSLRSRAELLLQDVLESGGGDGAPVHFIGHSIGGLDVRLLVSPGVNLSANGMERQVGKATRSVITIAAPHNGTPLANFLTTLQGRRVLQLLSLLATCGPGRYTLFQSARLLGMAAELDRMLHESLPIQFRRRTLRDALSTRALKKLTLKENDPVWTFLREIAHDQGAIIQLTPEAMDLYNAAVTDRRGVEYRCVLTAAPPPTPVSLLRYRTPARLASNMLFWFVHTITGREHSHYRYPQPSKEIGEKVRERLPFGLDAQTNDGFVPTLSQIYGEPIEVAVADHLDIVGQFAMAGGQAGSDWLPSGSRFDEERFQQVWSSIADVIAAS